MGIGVSIFFIALGAVLLWAVTASVAGISINVVGVILMVVGVIGLIAGLIASDRAGTRTREPVA
jgi:uncharacterized membrane protein YvlD (DUF360 family)